jgi:Flp pilus assembly pilin Flp
VARVEYSIIAVLVAIAAITVLTSVGPMVSRPLEKISNALSSSAS